MRLLLFIIGATLLSCGVAVLIFAIHSRAVHKRSFMASAVSLYLRIKTPKYTDDEVRRAVARLSKSERISKIKPPRVASRAKLSTVQEMQVASFEETTHPELCIIYFHGAGYVRPPRYQHWKFVARLAERTGARVVFPIYPKAPANTASSVYPRLTELYVSLRERYSRVILMGDSSGGGLALGLAERFLKTGIRKPDRLILLSPYVDLMLKNSEIPVYEMRDPLIRVSNQRIWSKSWAGELDVKDPMVSPIYGDMMGLPPVTLFAGTHEVLFPDIRMLHSIMKDSRVSVDFFIGRGMNHVYPIYPIPEARAAFGKIIAAIEKTA